LEHAFNVTAKNNMPVICLMFMNDVLIC